jgi:hypothetical protein
MKATNSQEACQKIGAGAVECRPGAKGTIGSLSLANS